MAALSVKRGNWKRGGKQMERTTGRTYEEVYWKKISLWKGNGDLGSGIVFVRSKSCRRTVSNPFSHSWLPIEC